MKLCFKGVTATYRRKTVLKNISFSVEPGSIAALIGRNGAGKSTLIQCLMGEKTDYLGGITLDGQDVCQLSLTDRASCIACLPQLLPRPHVTVRELVNFGRTPYVPLSGKLSQTDVDAVEQAISAVGLPDSADAYVDTLSGGEQKKAFFAMTLAQDTPVVILDEPTAHLDTASRFEFLDLLVKTNKTYLLVMHELPEVLRYADHIIAIHEHGVAFDGSPEECLALGIPESCFGVHITGSKSSGYCVTPVK